MMVNSSSQIRNLKATYPQNTHLLRSINIGFIFLNHAMFIIIVIVITIIILQPAVFVVKRDQNHLSAAVSVL